MEHMRKRAKKAGLNSCRVLRVAHLSLKQRHCVGGCTPHDTSFTVSIANNGLQLADRFVVPDELDLDARGYCLSDPDRLYEPPFVSRNTVPGPGRSSATTAFKRTVVTPPCTIRAPKGDLAASSAL